MGKSLLLIFSLICLLAEATPLKCITCHLRTRSDRCRRGFGVCTAQNDEICMNLKIYRNDKLEIIYLECQKFCRNLTVKLNSRTYVHKCCSHNYCNLKF